MSNVTAQHLAAAPSNDLADLSADAAGLADHLNGPIFSASVIAPRFRHDPDWPWLTRTSPLSRCRFSFLYIASTYDRFPRATRAYRAVQYLRALERIRKSDVAFLFSTDINIGMSGMLTRGNHQPKRIYVGFTQDAHWPAKRMRKIERALNNCDAVTVFTEEERRIYIERYRLDPGRIHVIPIHTDDTRGYQQYSGAPPVDEPYAVSLGIHNRRFEGVAQICRAMKIPLVILTRPGYGADRIAKLRELGANVITDADQPRAWNYLHHARMAIMVFNESHMPGGYTTLMNAMFMGTPFIVSQCLGMSEHVVDGETGFVTPHDDEESLRIAIGRLWSEPGLAACFGQAAHRRAQERHSLESAAKNFYRLACGVLGHDMAGNFASSARAVR